MVDGLFVKLMIENRLGCIRYENKTIIDKQVVAFFFFCSGTQEPREINTDRMNEFKKFVNRKCITRVQKSYV